MSKNIPKRVSRIISGSLNAIVSAVENSVPQIIMEEAIHEIDSALEEVRVELGKVIAAKHLSNKRLAEKNNTFEELSHKIELAISANRDDLAKAAISHQLDIEAQIPILEQSINENIEKEKELECYISALLAKKREMKEELKLFLENQQNAVNPTPESNSVKSSKKSIDKKVDAATTTFEKILEKQVGLSNLLKNQTTYLTELSELEKLSHNNRIEERLKTLKVTQYQKEDV